MKGGCGDGGTTPGENLKGPELFSIRNLAGNVWEWTADWYDPDYYRRAPKRSPRGPERPVPGFGRVQRGGGWLNTDPNDLRASARGQMPPEERYADVGFRCVVDDPPPAGGR
jgi:sulfatase modifying factor 1